ncbi:MAG: hypothetical protein IJ033_01865 [Clostridia bacterium]|nr:hypothetical protein [Clostridia bacterium]
MKILFVCSSNVCRSPYCEYHFKRLMESDDRLSAKVSECRSGAVFNRSAKIHGKAKKALLADGFDESYIDAHKPTFIKDDLSLFQSSDLIIGMTRWHKWCLPKDLRSKYVNLSEAAGGNYKAIPDPFLAPNQESYNGVMRVIKGYVERMAQKLIKDND